VCYPTPEIAEEDMPVIEPKVIQAISS